MMPENFIELKANTLCCCSGGSWAREAGGHDIGRRDMPQFCFPHPSRLALRWIQLVIMLVNKIQLFFHQLGPSLYHSNLTISRGLDPECYFFLLPFIQAIHGQRLPGVVIVFLGTHAFKQLLLVDAEGEDQMTHDDLPKLFLSVSITAGHISM